MNVRNKRLIYVSTGTNSMTSLCVVYTTSAVTILTSKMTGTGHSKT